MNLRKYYMVDEISFNNCIGVDENDGLKRNAILWEWKLVEFVVI
jgi:hypothetical protein